MNGDLYGFATLVDQGKIRHWGVSNFDRDDMDELVGVVFTVPKAGTPDHVRENCGALELMLADEDLGELDVAFPPPTGPRPLEML